MNSAFRFIFPLVLVVICNMSYQLLCKSTPSQQNPFTALFVSYGVSCLICAILMLLTKQAPFREELRQIGPLNILLGMVIIGVEGGYLMMYRSGWQVSKGPLAAYLCTAVVLLVAGAVLYQEEISIQKLMGMALCAGGILLMMNSK